MADSAADQVQNLSLQDNYDSHGLGNANNISHTGGGYTSQMADISDNSSDAFHIQGKADPFQQGSNLGGTHNGFEPHGGSFQGGYADLMSQSLHEEHGNTACLQDTQEGNLLGDFDASQRVTGQPVYEGEKNYFMSTGQPLLDLKGEGLPTGAGQGQNRDFQYGPPGGDLVDLMGDNSNMYSESSSHSKELMDTHFVRDSGSGNAQAVDVMSSSLYGTEDFEEATSKTRENIDLMNQEYYENESGSASMSQGQSEEERSLSWKPERDQERSRRSLSPERELVDSGSVSLGLGPDMTSSMYSDPDFSGPFSPERDSDRARRSLSPERDLDGANLMTDSMYEPEIATQMDSQSEMITPESQRMGSPEPLPQLEENEDPTEAVAEDTKRPTSLQHADSKIPSPKKVVSERVSSDQEESIGEPSKLKKASKSQLKSPRSRLGHIPRPQSATAASPLSAPDNKPEWNTYIREYGPSTIPTRKKDVKTPTTPTRPSTAPPGRRKKDASSDSGVEEDRTSRKSSAEAKKKYGVDTKNDKYKPGGGNVKIFNSKVEVKTVGSRIDTKPKASPKRDPTSPVKAKSPTPSPSYKGVQSKVGSMNNIKHSPGGGNVKVTTKKTDFANVTSKVGSKDKITHKPGGGDVKIQSSKLSWSVDSKVGSLDKVHHTPGGGNVKILDEKVKWESGSKVGTFDKLSHTPGGGEVKIEIQKVNFKESAQPKVGSMDKIQHQPGGGDKKIETQKLTFKETATARTVHIRKDSSSDK